MLALSQAAGRGDAATCSRGGLPALCRAGIMAGQLSDRGQRRQPQGPHCSHTRTGIILPALMWGLQDVRGDSQLAWCTAGCDPCESFSPPAGLCTPVLARRK